MGEFKHMGALLTDSNDVEKVMKHRFNLVNACYPYVQGIFFIQLLNDNREYYILRTFVICMRMKIYKKYSQ